MTEKCCDITTDMLKHRIYFEKKTRTADGIGGVTLDWTEDPKGGVYARLQNLTGSERWEAMRTMSGNLIRATVRFVGNAKGAPYWKAGTHRLRIRGRYYNIIAMQDKDFESEWLVVDAVEGEPS